MDTEALTRIYLLYVVMPLWLAVGVADWFCHRASHIEATSGWKESAIHLLMLAEVGIAVLTGLLLEINALAIVVMIACFVAHEITSHWDLAFAAPRRYISPLEQHIHNYLGTLPFMALGFVFVLHWPQLLALLGIGPETAQFTPAFKRERLPASYVAALLAAVIGLELLPYLEEWWRGWRQRPAPSASQAAPASQLAATQHRLADRQQGR